MIAAPVAVLFYGVLWGCSSRTIRRKPPLNHVGDLAEGVRTHDFAGPAVSATIVVR